MYVDFTTSDLDLSQADDYIQSMRDDEKRQKRMRNYFGMVKLIDDSMGRLLSTLSDLKLDDNTVIMFTADHGDLMVCVLVYANNKHFAVFIISHSEYILYMYTF